MVVEKELFGPGELQGEQLSSATNLYPLVHRARRPESQGNDLGNVPLDHKQKKFDYRRAGKIPCCRHCQRKQYFWLYSAVSQEVGPYWLGFVRQAISRMLCGCAYLVRKRTYLVWNHESKFVLLTNLSSHACCVMSLPDASNASRKRTGRLARTCFFFLPSLQCKANVRT